MGISSKVAVITGAGQGIGRAVALAFAREGAKVVIGELDRATGQAVASEICSSGGTALAVKTDVTERRQIENLLERSIERFCQVDIWVNNAGLIRPAMLHKMTQEDFDQVIDVHLKGTFMCVQIAGGHMRERMTGRIINVTSSAGILGTIGQINYSAAKGGIISITKSAARELARYNITVNCVAPAAATQMTEKILADQKLKELYLARIPLGRLAEPEEIAPAFVFLASASASYITGQVLCVDGGMVM
ncbi:MAG TPA: 3-oxoacyl-ACP reductase [Chloroflexi bacterium]|nr:3-oxoacyl-ACP reductase [Chloroflexota bacterium]